MSPLTHTLETLLNHRILAACRPLALQIAQWLHRHPKRLAAVLAAVLQLLHRAGLQRFQGYLFSRPLSRDDLVAQQMQPAPRSTSASA